MRGMLRRRFRVRAALGIAALYAFCVLAPHAALALGHAGAHCLTEEQSTAAHVHKAKAELSRIRMRMARCIITAENQPHHDDNDYRSAQAFQCGRQEPKRQLLRAVLHFRDCTGNRAGYAARRHCLSRRTLPALARCAYGAQSRPHQPPSNRLTIALLGARRAADAARARHRSSALGGFMFAHSRSACVRSF